MASSAHARAPSAVPSEDATALIARPLDAIQAIFDDDGIPTVDTVVAAVQKVSHYIQTHVAAHVSEIPSFNGRSADQMLPNHSLVQFRCMIQDTSLQSEMFCLSQKLRRKKGPLSDPDSDNCTSSDTKVVSTLFREQLLSTDFENGYEVDPCERARNFSLHHSCGPIEAAEKMLAFAVDVPHENNWMLSVDCARGSTIQQASHAMHTLSLNNNPTSACVEAASRGISSAGAPLEQSYPPLAHKNPSRSADGCALLKFYPQENLSESVKQSRVMHIYGVLEYMPVNEADNVPSDALINDDIECADFPAHTPVIHVVWYETFDSYAFPKPTAILAQVIDESSTEVSNAIREHLETNRFENVRRKFIHMLANILKGDVVAAEYVMMHIFSRVHSRPNGMPVGHVPLNLINCDSSMAQRLSDVFSDLLPRNCYIPINLVTLNSETFKPMSSEALRLLHQQDQKLAKKIEEKAKEDVKENDPSRHKLGVQLNKSVPGVVAGLFQVANGTSFILDETKLDAGYLNMQGTTNIQTVKRILESMAIPFDFGVHELSIECDIKVLVCSEGRSVFKVNVAFPVSTQSNPEPDAPALTESEKELLRSVLSYSHTAPYSIPEPVVQQIREFYATARQDGRMRGQDDLFSALNLARCYALSVGCFELEMSIWNRVNALEEERRTRMDTIAHIKQRLNSEAPAR